jgi:hypothetical protein
MSSYADEVAGNLARLQFRSMDKSSNDNALAGCAIIIAVLLGLSWIASFAGNGRSSNLDLSTIEDARKRGIVAGTEDGFNAGKAARLDRARLDGYESTVAETKASNDYFLVPLYCFLVVGGAFAIGYFGQFFLFYALRRAGILADIDRILLPKNSRVVQLRPNVRP